MPALTAGGSREAEMATPHQGTRLIVEQTQGNAQPTEKGDRQGHQKNLPIGADHHFRSWPSLAQIRGSRSQTNQHSHNDTNEQTE
jgi:hypothetical protein